MPSSKARRARRAIEQAERTASEIHATAQKRQEAWLQEHPPLSKEETQELLETGDGDKTRPLSRELKDGFKELRRNRREVYATGVPEGERCDRFAGRSRVLR